MPPLCLINGLLLITGLLSCLGFVLFVGGVLAIPALAGRRQVRARIIDRFERSDDWFGLRRRSAQNPDYLSWASDRLSVHEFERLQTMSDKSVHYIYIAEYSHSDEIVRAPLFQSKLGRNFRRGASVSLMVNHRDPRSPMLGSTRGNLLSALIGIVFGLLLLTGGCSAFVVNVIPGL